MPVVLTAYTNELPAVRSFAMTARHRSCEGEPSVEELSAGFWEGAAGAAVDKVDLQSHGQFWGTDCAVTEKSTR